MEELKLLIDLVAHLPAMALWVLVGFFAYKVVVVGSIYGVIRYVTGQLFSWLKERKIQYKEIRPLIDGITISASTDSLIAQLHRLKNKGVNSYQSQYIHESDVQWLREAIDDKIAKDLLQETKKVK